MRNLRAVAAGICLLALVSSYVCAQENATKPLTLQQCIDIALKNQVDLIAARNSLVSARSRVTSAVSGYFPQIQANAGKTFTGSNVGPNTSTTQSDTSATLSYDLLDGGVRSGQVKQAKAGVTASSESLQRTEQQVRFNITQSYFDLLRSAKLLAVADQQVGNVEAQRGLVKGRIDAEDAARSDIFPVEAQLANAKVSQLAAANAKQIAVTELQRAMGIAPSIGFEIVDVTDVVASDIPNLESCVQVALQKRPDIKQADAAVLISRASVGLAQVDVYPRLLANGRVTQGLGIWGDSQRDWQGFVGVSLNVFDGGAANAGVRDARAALSTTVARREQLKKDVAAEVQEAYLNLTSAHERMVASQASVLASQTNLEAQQERYKLGLATPVDLIIAQTADATAKSNAVQALYDCYVAQAQLDLAMGK